MDDFQTDTGAALAAGTALAKPITNPHPESAHAVLVPNGYALEYLTRDDAPFRPKGSVKMNDAASFVSYWGQQNSETSRIYGCMNPVAFTAVFDDHHGDNAGWREYRCVYTPKHSKEWQEWTARSKQNFEGNAAFAIWLEDHAIDITKPDPARMMDIAINIKVKQEQGFSNAVRLQDGNIQLHYTNEVTAGAKSAAGSNVSIPEQFTIEIPVFEGIGATKYKVDARFRYRLHGNGTLNIQFELVRPHKIVELAFSDLLQQIMTGTKQNVLFGSPE